MSRSYRKPYCAVTGVRSAHNDKTVAARCFRRLQNQAVAKYFVSGDPDWMDFICPVRLEANFNDTWSWGRDGCQSLQPEPSLADELRWLMMFSKYRALADAMADAKEWFEESKKRYARLKRK